jgi:serine/threonine protein kinase
MPQIWKIGDMILDIYQVTEFLGEGGFGEVYKVRLQKWGAMDLAVKIPKPEIIEAAGGVERFKQEAETWVNLNQHPNIVTCYYVRRVDVPVVFVEYLAGGSLHEWIRDRQLDTKAEKSSLQDFLDIAIQFAWGLHYAHEQGLIHQDVKPANVMLTLNGEVKITDFGIATPMATILNDPGTPAEITNFATNPVAQNKAMTLAYCSPEQASSRILTPRSDIWGWALSVLEMFQGRRTWSHGWVAVQALEYYLENKKEDSFLPQMPTEIGDLLRHCFQEKADARPHDMSVIVSKLKAIYRKVTQEEYPRLTPQAVVHSADSLNNRAISLWDLGMKEAALNSWNKALAVQPLHPQSTYYRGLTRLQSNLITYDDFIREMTLVKQSHSKNWMVDHLMSLVYLKGDDYPASISSRKNMLQKTADRSDIQITKSGELCNLTGQHLRPIGNDEWVGCMDDHFVLYRSDQGILKLWDIAKGK